MKLKSWLLIAAVFARGFSAVAETTEDYAAQEDLVACWDGVENAGTSGQHVDSLPDNEWRDTIGDVPLAMTAVTVEQDRLVFSGGNASGSHGNLTAENVAKTFDLCAVAGTLEVVYRSTVTTSNPMLVHGTATSGMAIGLYNNSSSFICGTGNGNQNYFKIPTGSSWTAGTNTVSVTYSTKRPLALFFNEEDADLAGNNQYWGDNQAYVTIGNRSKAYNQPFVGSIYAIRVYKRQLTAAEIAHNREIDEMRFIQGEVKDNEGLRITSTLQVCNPSSPEYGNYELEDGAELTVTIAEPEAKGVRSDAVCRGWKFYRRNPAKEWVLEDEGASLAYTYRHAAGAQAKLEWQWEETAVYGTRRYVQDGLVACWDGAENSGVSGGHLDVLSEWKDTLNNVAFSLTGSLTVTADGLGFPGAVTARGELSEANSAVTFTACKNGTLEIVLTPAASVVSATDTPLALCGSKDSGMAVGFFKKANSSVNYLITTYGSTGSPTIPYTVDDWTVPCQTVSVLYNNACSTSPGYLSGEAKASAENNSWGTFQSAKALLGCRFSTATTYQSPYAGKIHAIRLYNRQLTAGEIAANRAVDEDRFVNGNLAIGYQADFRVASVLKNSLAVAGQLLAARSAVRVFCRVRKTSEAPGEYMLLDDHWTVDEPLTKEYAELETGVEYTIDLKVEDPVTATCLTRTLTATPTARYPADCSVAGTLMADGSFLYVFDQVGTGELVMPPSGGTLKYLVVGGGGAGGSAVAEAEAAGGGGGGGGLATGTETLAGGTRIQVTVGAGGVPSLVADDSARNGGDSSIAYDTTEVVGRGGGAGGNNNGESGYAGGNGGGAGNGGTAGGAKTQEGGFAGIKSGSNNGGGGGGAGGSPSGMAVTNNQDGRPGGDGCAVEITGEAVYYAGGGASGSAGSGATAANIGVGGKGGGGSGGLAGIVEPMSGADGLGGGGGGAGKTGLGGRGGSGVVILRVMPNASAGETNPYAVIESATVSKAAPAVTIVGVLYAAGGEAETADLSLVWGTSPEALTEGEERLGEVPEGHFEITLDGLVPESEIYFALKASNAQEGTYEGIVRKATVAGPMSEPTLVITEQRGAVSYAVRVEDAGIGEGEVRLRWGTAPDRLDNEEVLGVLVPGSVFLQAGMVEVPDHQSVWFVAEAHSTADGKSWTKTTPAVQTGVWTLEGQLLKKDGWVFNVTISEDALTLIAPVLAAGKDLSPDFSDPIADTEGNAYRVVKIQTDLNPSAPPFFKGAELVGFTAPDMEELSLLALAEQPKIAGPLNFPKLTMLGSRMFQGDTGLKAVKLGSSKVGKLVFGSTGSQFDGQSDLLITFRTRVEVEPGTGSSTPQSFDGRKVFVSAGKPYILKMQHLEYLESWTGLSGFTAAADFTDEDRAFVAATIAASEHKVRNCPVLGIYQDFSHTAQKPQRHLVIGPGAGTCLMLK